MSDSSADRDPLDRLAEEFVARFRAGQRPSLTEYAERHPELAEQIRDLFPALVEMEQLKPVTADHTGAFTPSVEPSDPARIGEFRILRRVGHGGMGIVYEAVQESLGRHVALKLLPIDALADPKRLERFRREAKAAAKLHHTNIVPVFGTGESDGRHFYAMQFIAGHPLDAVIDEVRRLKEKSAPAVSRAISEVAAALITGTFARTAPPSNPDAAVLTATASPDTPIARAPSSSSEPSSPALSGSLSDGGHHYWATIARIGAQAADALVYAHAQGILHRDIKPANLLLDLRGTVWVTDFGLAKATDADDLTHAGDIVGTLRYMAPERFDGQGDHRADVYALGLTLYELLTLKPAFAAESRAKLVEQVLAASPPKPRSINPAIPRDLETIVLKAIARDPAMRYASASEMADDLRRYQEDRPIRARRASSAEQAWRWCRRNPAVASLLAVVLVVFGTGAGIASYFAVQAAAERLRAEGREKDANDERDKVQAGESKIRAEEDRIRRLLYASQMNHASVALSEGRIARVLEILEETTPKPGEPDLRGWEWYYLDRLTRPVGRSFALPGEGISYGAVGDPRYRTRSIDISADGSRLACVRSEGEGYRFEVWDTATGQIVARLPETGPPLAIPALIPRNFLSIQHPILSADGRTLVSWNSSSAQVRVWDVDSKRELPVPATLQGPDSSLGRHTFRSDAAGLSWVDSLRGGGRGSYLGMLTGAARSSPDYLIHRWDRASGQFTTQRFRPGDGKIPLTIANTSADGRIGLFHLDEGLGRPGRDLTAGIMEYWDIGANPPRRLWGMIGPRWSTTISPGGKMVAIREANSCTVYRAEGHGGGPEIEWKTALLPGQRSFQSIAVSDDGRLAISESHKLMILSHETLPSGSAFGEEEVTRQKIYYHHESEMYPIQFSRDGRTLLTVNQAGIIREWDAVPEPLHYPSPPLASPSDRFRIEPRLREPGDIGKRQIVDHILRDTKTGQEIGRFSGDGGRLSLNLVADSQRLLVNSFNLKREGLPPYGGKAIWTLYDTDGLRRIATGETSNAVGYAPGLEISPGGRWLIEGVGEREFIIRDPMTGNATCRVLAPETGTVSSIAFNRAEDRVVVVTKSTSTPAPTPEAVSIKGKLSVRMCDPSSGAIIWERQDLDDCTPDASPGSTNVGSRTSVQIVWSPDEQRLLIRYKASPTEGRVWVGRSEKGTTERTLGGPVETRNQFVPGGVTEWVSLDSAGRRAAVSGGKEVRIWDLESGSLIATVKDFDGIASETIFNLDGSRLFALDTSLASAVNSGRSTRIVVWDVATDRLLLVLQPPPLYLSDARNGNVMLSERALQFQDGKLIQTKYLDRRVFDGNPVKE
jgi:serine/threonine protein kinase/WD40 repeat protein